MNNLFIKSLIFLAILSPSLALAEEETIDANKIEFIAGKVPAGYEELYNNFTQRFYRDEIRNTRPNGKLEIEYSYIDNKLPTLTSYKFTEPCYSVTHNYIENRNAQKSKNEFKINYTRERVDHWQNKISSIYQDLEKDNSDQTYLTILANYTYNDSYNNGNPSTRKIILTINPKAPIWDYFKWFVDNELIKNTAIIGSSLEGNLWNFLDSTRDINPIIENSNDQVMKFILEPIEGNETSDPFYFLPKAD